MMNLYFVAVDLTVFWVAARNVVDALRVLEPHVAGERPASEVSIRKVKEDDAPLHVARGGENVGLLWELFAKDREAGLEDACLYARAKRSEAGYVELAELVAEG